MKTMPIPLRLDSSLLRALRDGARRTPHKQQDLIRLTLRRHLRDVIQEESTQATARITNIEPWPRGVVEKAYRRIGDEWDALEAAALRAQGHPRYED